MSFLTTRDGVRLRLCTRGTSGRPIVLVHGWKMSHRVFDHAILRLAREHRVVAFDLRGMGESDKPDSSYDFDELAGDLGSVIDQLGVEDATLVGWSMGCTVALKYLENGGGGIRRLALVNGPIRLTPAPDHSFTWTMSEATLERYFAAIEREWPTRERAFTMDSLHRPDDELVETILALTRQTPLDVMMKVVREQAKLDFRTLLPRLDLPVLAIYGRHDPFYPAELGRWIAEQCPRGESLIFEESAHFPFIEERDRFAREIAAFTRRAV
jgi:pimeloyl-ACP methyl ester carboxylesterase